eukprot:c18375_g1_i2.p1 GENE.c18375_g1_i2~~c18375_g1_i2.p1  ORF type:complete len:340 (-),score=119.04 c18375_g1_i2:21-1040(-)
MLYIIISNFNNYNNNKGLEILEKRKGKKNDVASVLVMTDGLANRGVMDIAQLTKEIKLELKKIGSKITIYTFGFGDDHHSGFLTCIAESGGGSYYFMRTLESIPYAFADCIGGLLSVVAQNIVLRVHALEDVEINTVETGFIQNIEEEKKVYSVSFGDIFAEENRDIVISFQLPSVNNPIDSQKILSLQLEYFDVILSKPQKIETTLQIKRVESYPTSMVLSEYVESQKNRIKTAHAMQNAMKKTDIFEARLVLDECRAAIEQSYAAAMSAYLISDLKQIISQMTSQLEWPYILRLLTVRFYEHSNQRSSSSDTRLELYTTKIKSLVRKTWHDAFDPHF